MTRVTKKRTINYKLAQTGSHALTLQAMLEKALLDKSSGFYLATNRRESLTEDGRSFRFINRFLHHNDEMLLCQIVQFEQGRSQMTIILDDTAEMFELNPIFSKDFGTKNSDKTEFLESMAYFGVMGNHLVVMGSQILKSKELERHLNWFLNELTNLFTGKALFLSDKPSEKALKQLAQSPAKSVSIGSDITYEQDLESINDDIANDASDTQKTITEAKSVRWTPAGLGANILECLKDNGYIGQFDFSETLDDANLQVSIEFKYNRKTTRSGQKVIDTLSTSLRHIDKDDVKINLKGGGEIKGDDLKLSHTISLAFLDEKVDESDLYFKMKDWLESKVIKQEVTPDLQDVIEEK